MPNCPISPFSN